MGSPIRKSSAPRRAPPRGRARGAFAGRTFAGWAFAGWAFAGWVGAAAALGLLMAACAATPLPVAPPPLEDLEEPPAWLEEPADEGQRERLAAGSFSGLRVADARRSLEALAGEPEGLEVVGVVEGSPAAAAGLAPGDLLLEVLAPREVAGTQLAYPSQWRDLELALEPGTRVELLVDRAGLERRAALVLAPRVAPAPRHAGERFREELRAGVVLRTATEVEARAAGLAPGAGAVIVGLSRASPWRAAGLRYGDLVRAVDGRTVHAPLVLIDAIRRAEEGAALELAVVRAGEELELAAPLTRRQRVTRNVHLPLLARYERDPDRRSLSLLLGLVRHERTRAAWRLRLLYFMRFERGDSERLAELGG